MAIIQRSGESQEDLNTVYKEVNGLLDTTNLSPNARIPLSKTTIAAGLSSTLQKGAMYVQSITTDALTNNQVIYRGWGYTTNIGAATGTITITLPNGGFDNVNYFVSAMVIGRKSGAAPTSPADVDSFNNNDMVMEDATLPRSTTQFKLYFLARAGNLAVEVFDWMAIGTKA